MSIPEQFQIVGVVVVVMIGFYAGGFAVCAIKKAFRLKRRR